MKTVKLLRLSAPAMLMSLAPQSLLAQEVAGDAGRCSEGDGSSLGQAYCMREYRDELEAAQGRLLAQIHGALKGKGPDQTDYAAAARYLDEAQKHWQEFVGADCAVRENVFGAGSAFALDGMDCEIEHYRRRNDQLEEFRKNYVAE